jgi:hypothetical protein
MYSARGWVKSIFVPPSPLVGLPVWIPFFLAVDTYAAPALETRSPATCYSTERQVRILIDYAALTAFLEAQGLATSRKYTCQNQPCENES